MLATLKKEKNKIHLFLLWLCQVLVAAVGSFRCGEWPSHPSGLSCCKGLWAVGTGSGSELTFEAQKKKKKG